MRFLPRQRATLIALIVGYTVAYFNRLNLSAALNSVITAYSVTAVQGGLCQSLFSIVYAAGQLINGAIVDRVNPKNHFCIGLSGSAVCNFLMGVCPAFPFFLALCVLNGAFQSMLWTSLLRLVAAEFPDTEQRNKANFYISFTLVAGHFGAWAIAGGMIDTLGWRLSFIVPACIAVVSVFIIAYLLKDCSACAAGGQNTRQAVCSSPVKTLLKTGFLPILIGCLPYGFVKDGIVTWAPSILQSLASGTELSSTLFSLIIPLLNTLGLLTMFFLLKRVSGSARKVTVIMLAFGFIFCLFLPVRNQILWVSIFLGAACACMYGMNKSLTSLIPMEYYSLGCVALSGGLIDSMVYLGSSISGVVSGALIERHGYGILYWIWAALSLTSALLMWISCAKRFQISYTKGASDDNADHQG